MFPDATVAETHAEDASAGVSPSPRGRNAAEDAATSATHNLNDVATGDRHMRQSFSPEASAENVDPTAQRDVQAAFAMLRPSQPPLLAQLGDMAADPGCSSARNTSPPVAFRPSPQAAVASGLSAFEHATQLDNAPVATGVPGGAATSPAGDAMPVKQQLVVPFSPPQTPPTARAANSTSLPGNCSLQPILGFDDVSTDSPLQNSPPASGGHSTVSELPLSLPLVDTCMQHDDACDVVHDTPESPCISAAMDGITEKAVGSPPHNILISARSAAACTPTGSSPHRSMRLSNIDIGTGITNSDAACIVADAHADMSSSPSNMGQCSPPKLPTCSPCAHPGCACLLYTSPSPRDRQKSRMPSSA